MPQTPVQGSSSRIFRAWLVLALMFAVMGGLVMVYNPLAGGALLLTALLAGWRGWRNRAPPVRELGLTLEQDPVPGALGGDVGGWLRYGSDEPPLGEARVTLSCIRLCERQRSQIIEHRREPVWQETRPLLTDPDSGVLGFCFTPPAHLPGTEPSPEIGATEWSCHHYWTLTLEAVAGGRAVTQGFRLTVKPGTQTMKTPFSQAQRDANTPVGLEQVTVASRLKERLGLREEAGRLVFEDSARPASWSGRGAMAGGIVLVAAGMNVGGLGAWLLAVAGLWLGGRHLYRRGQTLNVELEGRDIRVTTSWFGRPLFARHGELTSREQLILKPALLSGLSELLLDNGTRRLLLAKELPADEAEALREILAERIVPE